MLTKTSILACATLASSALLVPLPPKPQGAGITHLSLIDCTTRHSNLTYSAIMGGDQVALVGLPAITWERQNTSGIFSTGYAVTVSMDASPWGAVGFNRSEHSVMNYTCERGQGGEMVDRPGNATCLVRYGCVEVKGNGTKVQ